MRSVLFAAGAALALTLGASAVNAQVLLDENPNTDTKTVVNLQTEQEPGALAANPAMDGRPIVCPAGTFLIQEDVNTDQKEVSRNCADTGEEFRLGMLNHGALPAEGYPAGSQLITEDTRTDHGGVRTATEAASPATVIR